MKVLFVYDNGRPYHATNVSVNVIDDSGIRYTRMNKRTRIRETYTVPKSDLAGIVVTRGSTKEVHKFHKNFDRHLRAITS